jgi:hypothetical protein
MSNQEWIYTIEKNYEYGLCGPNTKYKELYPHKEILIHWYKDKQPKCETILNWIVNGDIILGYPKMAVKLYNK